MGDGFCQKTGPAPNFFFLIYNQHRVMISAGERENHRARSACQGEPRIQENAILPVFAQQPCTGGLHIYTERLSSAQSKTGNQSPDAVKGLPSRDLNCTPFEEVSLGQSQGTLAAKGKENFTAAAPLGWLHRGAEDFSPQ